MKFSNVIQEAVIDMPTYKLAKDAINKYKVRRPSKVVDRMIQDARTDHKKQLLQRKRKEIEQAIPHILNH